MIDLEPFCEARPHHCDTDRPWINGGLVYATNGSVIVRVPEAEAMSYRQGKGCKVPSPAIVDRKMKSARKSDLKPMPLDLEHFIDDWWIACAMLDGVCLNLRNYKLICGLPNVRYAVSRWTVDDDGKDCIYFEFDGGEGVVLGRSPLPQPERLPQ